MAEVIRPERALENPRLLDPSRGPPEPLDHLAPTLADQTGHRLMEETPIAVALPAMIVAVHATEMIVHQRAKTSWFNARLRGSYRAEVQSRHGIRLS
jgi:hypothetical protein